MFDRAKFQRDFFNKRVTSGLCADCGKAQSPYSRWYCDKHRIKRNRLARQRKTVYKQATHPYDFTSAKRDIVYSQYGNKCACCHESNPMFLSIDHVDNNGASERPTVGFAAKLYHHIINLGFPAKYQLLCMNCNFGKFRNRGTCPHITTKTTDQENQ